MFIIPKLRLLIMSELKTCPSDAVKVDGHWIESFNDCWVLRKDDDVVEEFKSPSQDTVAKILTKKYRMKIWAAYRIIVCRYTDGKAPLMKWEEQKTREMSSLSKKIHFATRQITESQERLAELTKLFSQLQSS